MSNETKLAREFLDKNLIEEYSMTASMHISCLCDVVENQQKRIDELESLVYSINKAMTDNRLHGKK